MEHDDLPPHLIRRRDVAAWLAGSAVCQVTYHRTSRASAEHIRRVGVRIEASRLAAYGQGFYTATTPDAFFGDVAVPVAIRMRRPLDGSIDAIEEVIDRIVRRVRPLNPLLTPDVAPLVRRELLELGYDGIVVRDGGGDGVDYVIAMEASSVKVVSD